MKPRLFTGVALAGLALAVAGIVAGPVGAKRPLCDVLDRTSGAHASALQVVVDAAAAGDTIAVKGTCIGTTTITKRMTVIGQATGGFGPATLDGGGTGAVVAVCTSAPVALSNLTITGGLAAGNPFPGDTGGGIYNCGPLSLTNVTVTGNTAWQGAGIENFGTLTLRNSTVTNNQVQDGQSGGFGAMGGGGIYDNALSTTTLVDSTISNNTAPVGAGVYQDLESSLTLRGHTRIAGNTATFDGGGIEAGDIGATISCLDTSSITGNTGGGIGGGIDFTRSLAASPAATSPGTRPTTSQAHNGEG